MSFITVYLLESLPSRFTDLSVGVPLQVPPPSGVQPRPRVEGEAGGRRESQLTTQSRDRPKEGEEDFNSSLGLISLAGTYILKENIYYKKIIK